MSIPFNSQEAVAIGIDKLDITFDTPINNTDYQSNAIQALENNLNSNASKDNKGYALVVYLHYAFTTCWIGIDSFRRNGNPHKLKANLAKMSDAELIDLRRILRKIFGYDTIYALFHTGNITSIEWFLDLPHTGQGDFIPVSKTKKWAMWGKNENIESHYHGNKLYKSYSKTSYYNSKAFKASIRSMDEFVFPSFEISRIEITKNYAALKKDSMGSLHALVSRNKNPFLDAEFIDIRLLNEKSILNDFEIFYLQAKGRMNYLALAKRLKSPVQYQADDLRINTAVRKGVTDEVAQCFHRSIGRINLLNPDFDIKTYKQETENTLLKYHHFGFITRELLDMLGMISHPRAVTAPECKTLLKEWFGTHNANKLAGRPLSKERAETLLLAQAKHEK